MQCCLYLTIGFIRYYLLFFSYYSRNVIRVRVSFIEKMPLIGVQGGIIEVPI